MGLLNFLKRRNDKDEQNDTLFEEYEVVETLSVSDAADIWASSGFDEDRMFGYTSEELERALK